MSLKNSDIGLLIGRLAVKSWCRHLRSPDAGVSYPGPKSVRLTPNS